MEAGRVGLERLYPGFESSIGEAGGLTIDAATELQYFHHGDYLADGPDPLPMICASRPLFEHTIRERTRGVSNVTIDDAAGAATLVFSDHGVTGARLEDDPDPLEGDFVVDARGRSSPTPQRLEREGLARPRCDAVTIDLTYASMTVDRPPATREGYLLAPSPANPRGGTVVPIEDDRWMATLFGVHGCEPPGSPEGFRVFAVRLPAAEPREILRRAPWRGDRIHRYPFPSNRWYRYEGTRGLPRGLVATGDAVASFNPIYGQGMSVAVLDALHLHAALREDSERRVSDRYYEDIAGTIRTIWRMTVGADFTFAETTGPKPSGTRIFNWYLERFVRAAHDDGVLADAFARVLRLEQDPTALLHPRLVRRVFLP